MDCKSAKDILIDALASNFKSFHNAMQDQEKDCREVWLQRIAELNDEDFAKVIDFVDSLHPCEPKEKDTK